MGIKTTKLTQHVLNMFPYPIGHYDVPSMGIEPIKLTQTILSRPPYPIGQLGMTLVGIEPTTFRLEGGRSIQLSYNAVLNMGIEPIKLTQTILSRPPYPIGQLDIPGIGIEPTKLTQTILSRPPYPIGQPGVSLTGFEPATSRLEGECSIQLSYSDLSFADSHCLSIIPKTIYV
jgi:hypothetical protein